MAKATRGNDKFTLDGGGNAIDGPISSVGNGLDDYSSNAGGNDATIDPASLGGSPSGGEPSGSAVKRGRGRPKGTAKAKAAPQPLDIGSVETILFNIHAMVAAATGYDKIALTEGEANSLAKAVSNVQQYYPMHVSAKAMAWTNLIMVAGGVYGSRVVAIWADQQKVDAEKPASPATIYPIRPLSS